MQIRQLFSDIFEYCIIKVHNVECCYASIMYRRLMEECLVCFYFSGLDIAGYKN